MPNDLREALNRITDQVAQAAQDAIVYGSGVLEHSGDTVRYVSTADSFDAPALRGTLIHPPTEARIADDTQALIKNYKEKITDLRQSAELSNKRRYKAEAKAEELKQELNELKLELKQLKREVTVYRNYYFERET